MRNKEEYEVCKALATYLRLQYPKLLYHYDLAGLSLSQAQAGMMKAIQGGRGWPDLNIVEAKGVYAGFFLEIKKNGTKLYKKDGMTPTTPHIEEQMEVLDKLRKKRYYAEFGIGLDDCMEQINNYLKLT